MKIYYSMPYAFERILGIKLPYEAISSSGWGHLIEQTEIALVKVGHEIVTNPHDADIEFFVSQPPFRLKPEMHPTITLSMYESTRLPSYWASVYNKFDAVINPSHWGKHSYEQSGVTVPIYVVPLGVNTDRFKYVEHKVETKWIYVSQGVQLTDRKGLMKVAELFFDGKMPTDTYLLLKTTPHRLAPMHIYGVEMHPQIQWFQDVLPWEKMTDLLSQCHVSVNPSAGEGFGQLPCEHSLLGMCVLMIYYSGFEMFANQECNIPIKHREVVSTYYAHGMMAEVDTDDMLQKMLWTYEHQDKALAMGKRASEWIAETFTYEKMVTGLLPILEHVVKTVPKTVQMHQPGDSIDEWVNRNDTFGFRVA